MKRHYENNHPEYNYERMVEVERRKEEKRSKRLLDIDRAKFRNVSGIVSLTKQAKKQMRKCKCDGCSRKNCESCLYCLDSPRY